MTDEDDCDDDAKCTHDGICNPDGKCQCTGIQTHRWAYGNGNVILERSVFIVTFFKKRVLEPILKAVKL